MADAEVRRLQHEAEEEVAEGLQEGFDLAILLRQLVEASSEAEESMKSAFDPAKVRHGGAGAQRRSRGHHGTASQTASRTASRLGRTAMGLRPSRGPTTLTPTTPMTRRSVRRRERVRHFSPFLFAR